MFSYGSGLSSTLFSLKLQEGQHPFSLSKIASVLDVSGKLESRHVVCLIPCACIIKFLVTIVSAF